MWGDDGEGMGWMEPMTRSKKIILGSSRHVWVRRLIVLASRGFSMHTRVLDAYTVPDTRISQLVLT